MFDVLPPARPTPLFKKAYTILELGELKLLALTLWVFESNYMELFTELIEELTCFDRLLLLKLWLDPGPSSKREFEQTDFYFLADNTFSLVDVYGVFGIADFPYTIAPVLISLPDDKLLLPRVVAFLLLKVTTVELLCTFELLKSIEDETPLN